MCGKGFDSHLARVRHPGDFAAGTSLGFKLVADLICLSTKRPVVDLVYGQHHRSMTELPAPQPGRGQSFSLTAFLGSIKLNYLGL